MYATSALHPDLRDPEQQEVLAQQWGEHGIMRIEGILEPGLAAELALVCAAFPLQTRMLSSHQDLSWSCDVGIPEIPDPQQPECLFRLMRFLQVDLPALVSTITGRPLTRAEDNTIHLWSLRKGSYVDAGAPLAHPGGIDVTLGLTGANWPAELGGHVFWQRDDGPSYGVPPGFDTLDLFDGGAFVIPMMTRHIHTLAIRTYLNPVEAADDST